MNKEDYKMKQNMNRISQINIINPYQKINIIINNNMELINYKDIKMNKNMINNNMKMNQMIII